MPDKLRICAKGVWDSTIPGITFDENGISNYAKMFYKLTEAYPRGREGKLIWEEIADKIKKEGKGKRYDCVVGVSGGTDSSYLLHLAGKEYNLRPLAVNLDNGWSSDIAVKNIKRMTNALDIDLETYVIDYEEVKSVLKSYIKASLPWIDSPTDLAIKAVLYKIADREGIKYILNGSDFRTEGKQPTEWTYTDAKQLNYLVSHFEKIKLKSFPYYTLWDLFNYGFRKKIKMYRPFYYLDYQKKTAQQFLENKYDWQYYGGHHHENIFTKFSIAYWLPRKFGIDKRKITYSAQILNMELSRDDALEMLKKYPYSEDQMEIDKNYVIKKLGLTPDEFENYWNRKNKFYFDYPSYMPFILKYNKYLVPAIKNVLPFTPSILYEQQMRNSKEN